MAANLRVVILLTTDRRIVFLLKDKTTTSGSGIKKGSTSVGNMLSKIKTSNIMAR